MRAESRERRQREIVVGSFVGSFVAEVYTVAFDKKSVLRVLNDRLMDINVHLDIEEAIRVVLGGQFSGISFTIDIPHLRTVRILVEAGVIERIGWMDHLTIIIYDQTTAHAKFVTSCKMLADSLHSGFYGMFPHLVEGHNYYIQFN